MKPEDKKTEEGWSSDTYIIKTFWRFAQKYPVHGFVLFLIIAVIVAAVIASGTH